MTTEGARLILYTSSYRSGDDYLHSDLKGGCVRLSHHTDRQHFANRRSIAELFIVLVG